MAQTQSIVGGELYSGRVLRDGPTAYWRLEESGGLSAIDSTGNGHTITLPGSGITYSVAGALADGTNGFGLSSSTARASLTAIAMGTTCTFELWFRPTAGVTAYTTLFTPNAGGTGLYFNSSTRKLDLFFGAADHFSTTALTAGTLYHIVVSVAAGAVTFYINGVADGTAAGWPGVSVDTVFNQGGGGAALAATLIDEMALYASTALTAEQVAAHYGMRLAVSSGLRASGAATPHCKRTVVASGGVRAGGAATIRRGRVVLPSGGVRVSGAGSAASTFAVHPRAAARVVDVAAESRVVAIPSELRGLVIPFDNRVIAVPAEAA